jgi:hypothetical protein
MHHAVFALMVAACTPPAQTVNSEVEEAPPEALALIEAEMPGFIVNDVESEETDGQREYEVAGTTPSGEEYEFDLMQSSAGWSIMEVQRDIAWADAPEAVRAAAAAAPNAFEPTRVIESRQPADGSVIYELFSPNHPGAPAMEVRFLDGEAAVMPPAH